MLVMKAAVTAVIFVVVLRNLDSKAILIEFSSISLYPFFATVPVLLAQVLVSSKRLILVVALFGHRFSLWESVRVTIESMFFSQTFVSFLGGDALRFWRIHKAGLSASHSTIAVFLDRSVGTIVNHLCLLAALPWLIGAMVPGPVRAALIFLGGAGIAGTVLLLWLGTLPQRTTVASYLPQHFRLRRIVALLFEAATVGRYLISRWRDLAPVGGWSLLTVAGNCLIFFLILWGMGVNSTNAFYCSLLVPAVLEVAMLPISIAGWGVREATTIMAFGNFGVAPNLALAASLTFGLVLAGVSLSGGIVWLLDNQRLRAPV